MTKGSAERNSLAARLRKRRRWEGKPGFPSALVSRPLSDYSSNLKTRIDELVRTKYGMDEWNLRV